MQLIKGENLTEKQLKLVKSAFIYRHLAIGAGKAYPTESAWIKDHAFYFKKDGNIPNNPRHCEPVWMAE